MVTTAYYVICEQHSELTPSFYYILATS